MCEMSELSAEQEVMSESPTPIEDDTIVNYCELEIFKKRNVRTQNRAPKM